MNAPQDIQDYWTAMPTEGALSAALSKSFEDYLVAIQSGLIAERHLITLIGGLNERGKRIAQETGEMPTMLNLPGGRVSVLEKDGGYGQPIFRSSRAFNRPREQGWDDRVVGEMEKKQKLEDAAKASNVFLAMAKIAAAQLPHGVEVLPGGKLQCKKTAKLLDYGLAQGEAMLFAEALDVLI